MNLQKILIIGGSGQLGTALREVFSDKQIKYPTHQELMLSLVDYPEDGGTPFEKAIQGVDLVINAAAYHNVRECEENPSVSFQLNAIKVGYMAKACAKRDMPFVTVSTDYVFEGERREYSPYSPCNPLNVYGVSKLAGEHLVLNANSRSTIIRTAGLYGPSGFSGKGPHFLERVLRMTESRETFRAVDDVFFSPSYAPYVATAMREIIESEDYGVRHVAGTGCVSWFEFARYARYVAFSGTAYDIGIIEPIKIASLNEPFTRPEKVDLVSKKSFMPRWERGVEEYIHQRSTRKNM
jgi:dTDP-4-dehydrorhamnose reductase